MRTERFAAAAPTHIKCMDAHNDDGNTREIIKLHLIGMHGFDFDNKLLLLSSVLIPCSFINSEQPIAVIMWVRFRVGRRET